MRLSQEEVSARFTERGFTLLERDYKNSNTPMLCICSCGKETKLSLSNFMRGSFCKECGRKNTISKLTYSYDYVSGVFERGGCKLISTEYISSKSPLEYICECGDTATIAFDKFNAGQRCVNCGIKKSAEAKLYKIDEVYKIFAERGYILHTNDYQSCRQKLEFTCDKGHTSEISFTNFTKGRGCWECGRLKMSGETHPQWNPDLTDEDRERSRRIKGMEDWRTAVFTRDKYTCQKCFVTGSYLHAHHIFSYDRHKDKRIDVTNGVTLCKYCHRNFHSQFGFGNNTEQQFITWLGDYNGDN